MKTEAGWAKYEEVLLHCFLFSGFDAPRLSRVLSGRGEILTFRAGQTIFSPHCFKRAVGIFLKGKAQAEKAAEGRTVVLNRFEPPMMFGAAAVFRQAQEYVTQVTAKTLCQVLFLTDKELDAIFREDFAAARNYISFLSERIAFLNRKIDSFTKGSAEEKMALYLHDQCMGRSESFSIACSPHPSFPGAWHQPRYGVPGAGPFLPAGIYPAGWCAAAHSGRAGPFGLAGAGSVMIVKKGKPLLYGKTKRRRKS